MDVVSWRPKTEQEPWEFWKFDANIGNWMKILYIAHQKTLVVLIKYMYNQEYMQIIWATHIQHTHSIMHFENLGSLVLLIILHPWCTIYWIEHILHISYGTYLLVSNDKLSSLSYFVHVMNFKMISESQWMMWKYCQPRVSCRWLFLKNVIGNALVLD